MRQKVIQRCRIFLTTATVIAGFIAAQPAAAQDNAVNEQQIRTHLAVAQQAERSKDYPSARRAYQAIIKLRPDWALIHQSLALTYHLENRYPQAIEAFQRALKLDDQLWGAYLFLGMDYYKTNQFDRAVPALQRSLALNPERAEFEARFWLGLSFLALGQHDQAIEQLQRLTQVRPGDIEVLFHLARAYDRQGSALFEKIGQIEPRSSLVYLLQAERSAAENRLDLALVDYRRALELRPDFRGMVAALSKLDSGTPPAPATGSDGESEVSRSDIRANYELGEFFLRQGDDTQGLGHLRRVESQTPTDSASERYVQAARERLGREAKSETDGKQTESASNVLSAVQALQTGQFEPAIEGLENALEHDDGRHLRLFLTRAYFGANRNAEAETEARNLLEEDPQDLDALYWLGQIQKQRAASTLAEMIRADPDSYRVHELEGERHEENTAYEKALESYEKALKKRPTLAGIRYAIGNVYWKTRQYELAEKWLREEIERNPYHGLAHYRLGSLYADQGKAALSVSHLEQALAASPGLITARLDLGRALMATERYEEAASEFEAYAKADPANDRVHYLLANAYKKLGRTADARRAMKQFQELNRRRLERVQGDVREVSESLADEKSSSPER